VTERWCQAVRELYEIGQNSATGRKDQFAQDSIANVITFGSFRDDVPNQFDNQQFLCQSDNTGNGSQRNALFDDSGTSQYPATSQFITDLLQTSAPETFQIDDQERLLCVPTAEITQVAKKKVEEERAMLEAMTQSISLPVSPYLDHAGLANFPFGTAFTSRDPGDKSIQFATQVPVCVGLQGQMAGIGVDEFPSLDEIIRDMEGSQVDDGFGFLDDLSLFDGPF